MPRKEEGTDGEAEIEGLMTKLCRYEQTPCSFWSLRPGDATLLEDCVYVEHDAFAKLDALSFAQWLFQALSGQPLDSWCCKLVRHAIFGKRSPTVHHGEDFRVTSTRSYDRASLIEVRVWPTPTPTSRCVPCIRRRSMARRPANRYEAKTTPCFIQTLAAD